MPLVEIRGEHRRPIEFLAVGHLAVDLREGRRVLGGASAFSALTASRLGLASAIVTAVGEDFDLFDPLEKVEVHCHREGRSTSFENLYRDGVREQHLLGRARRLVEADLASVLERLAGDAIVLYCPLAREIDMPLSRRAPSGLTGVAPQGFFREWDAAGRVVAREWVEAEQALYGVDVLSLSEHDAPNLETFVAVARKRARVLAVTIGARGARLFSEESEVQVRAWVRPEVDPTGAGDVFAGALLVALREGQTPVAAAELACCAASFAVEKPGVEGVPEDRAAVEARLLEYRRGT